MFFFIIYHLSNDGFYILTCFSILLFDYTLKLLGIYKKERLIFNATPPSHSSSLLLVLLLLVPLLMAFSGGCGITDGVQTGGVVLGVIEP